MITDTEAKALFRHIRKLEKKLRKQGGGDMKDLISFLQQYNKAIAGFVVSFLVLFVAKFGFSLSVDFQALLVNLISSLIVGGAVYQIPNKE